MQRIGVVGQYDRFIQTAPGGAAVANEFDLDKYVVGKTWMASFTCWAKKKRKYEKTPQPKPPSY
jgi:hypothetical protein